MSTLRRQQGTRKINVLNSNIIQKNVKLGFSGPICDSIGFSQHTGQCWHDTMLQIFFFSDGFKDYVQPLFYNLSYNDIITHVDTYFNAFSSNIKKSVEYQQSVKGAIVKYIKMIRDRFINHYNYLTRVSKEELCIRRLARREYETAALAVNSYIKKHANLKRATSTKLGIQSAYTALNISNIMEKLNKPQEIEYIVKPGQKAQKINKNKINIEKLEALTSTNLNISSLPVAGGNNKVNYNMLYLLINIFNVPFTIDYNYFHDLNSLSGIIHSSILYSNTDKDPYADKVIDKLPMALIGDGTEYKRIQGAHSSGFIRCNNMWQYYDDNVGILPIRISNNNRSSIPSFILENYVNQSKPIVLANGLLNNQRGIYFLQTEEFINPQTNMIESTITQLYNGTKWVNLSEVSSQLKISVILYQYELGKLVCAIIPNNIGGRRRTMRKKKL